jgi:RimK family alpha-L-glutamate ligase
MSDPVRVGVLSLHESKESKAILNAAADLGAETAWLRRENLEVTIDDGVASLDPAVDVVVNRLLLSNTDQPCEDLGIGATVASLVPTLNPPSATLVAIHKVATATTLASAGIPVPDATMATDTGRLNAARDRYGESAVYKTAIGTHGGGTWKVGSTESVTAQVGQRQAFLQRMIQRSDVERNRDLRIYVVDGEVVGAMRRYAPEGDWRTNVALGGDVEAATDELTEAAATMAVDAADAIGLDYAGVDVIEDDDGWYVLEVNPTAGFRGLFRATDVSPAPHIARLAIERAGGQVDDVTVEDLARTLDDSEPAATPDPSPRESSAPVDIGLTEEVVVTGTAGSATVVAKADTGAARTSIDTTLAAEVGAGPIRDLTKVKSGSAKAAKSRPLVDIVVGIGGIQHTVTASVEDRSHMSHQLLLGRDVLENYRVNVGKEADDDRS